MIGEGSNASILYGELASSGNRLGEVLLVTKLRKVIYDDPKIPSPPEGGT